MRTTDENDPKLNQLLGQWTVPPASDDAISRILAKALVTPQVDAGPTSMWNRIVVGRASRLVIAATAIAAGLVVVTLPQSLHSHLPANDPVLQQSALVAFDVAKSTGSAEEELSE